LVRGVGDPCTPDARSRFASVHASKDDGRMQVVVASGAGDHQRVVVVVVVGLGLAAMSTGARPVSERVEQEGRAPLPPGWREWL
jgi:hypothetical protein